MFDPSLQDDLLESEAVNASDRSLQSWMKQSLVHFSFKAVNSNIQPGGIRLSRQAPSAFPHVHVRGLLGESVEVPLDYMGDAAKNAGPFSDYGVATGEVPVGRTKGNPGEYHPRPAILEANAVLLDQPLLIGMDRVSPRQRQLLLPTEDGEYLAISPLSCSGLCELIDRRDRARRQEINAHKDSKSPLPRPWSFRRVRAFSVGGSNPQNVGGRMRSMRPLVAPRWPTLCADERRAWRLFHNGFRPRLPRAAVRVYAEWLTQAREKNRAWTLAQQQVERQKLNGVWAAIHEQAQLQRRLFDQCPDVFTHDDDETFSLATNQMTSWNRGWLFGDRSPQWRAEVGQWFAHELERYQVGRTEEGQAIQIGLTHDDVRRIANLFSQGEEYVA